MADNVEKADAGGYSRPVESGVVMKMKPVHQEMEYYPITEEQLDSLTVWSYGMTIFFGLAGAGIGFGVDSIREHQIAALAAELTGDAATIAASMTTLNWVWMCVAWVVLSGTIGTVALWFRRKTIGRVRKRPLEMGATP